MACFQRYSSRHPPIPCGCVVICRCVAVPRRLRSPDIMFLHAPADVARACISFFSLFVPVIPLTAFRLPDDREPVSEEPILPRCCSIAGPGIFVGYWNRPFPVLCQNCVGQAIFFDLPFPILSSWHAYARQRAEFYQITAFPQCFFQPEEYGRSMQGCDVGFRAVKWFFN
jgi:hypothetical protein